MKSIFLVLLLISIVFSKVNYEEELVVQLTSLEHLPQLNQALQKLEKKNQEQLIPYVTPEQLQKSSSPSLKELSTYFVVETNANDEEKKTLQKYLLSLPFVKASYIKPSFINAEYKDDKTSTTSFEINSDTPLFVERQIYRNKAPEGVNVQSVQHIPGSSGEGVTVFDVEQGFNFEHEDIIQHNGRVLVGRPVESSANHGVAVCGVISGFQNNFGITGISHKSKIHGCSFHYQGSQHPRVGPAIVACTEFTKAGDIMLLEMHAIGPNRNFIAMEWWPDNYLAIKSAVEKGVIVIAAGGNGNENLDNPIYNIPLTGFPRDWKNPFNRSLADSHAIIVGAGAPPPGTHGRNYGPDRSRLDFSNYGSAVDCQGWGREVTTLGYGDLQRIEKNRLYTDTFSGTSSASPVVVGAIASIQGILLKRGFRMDSETARYILRKSGSVQQDAPGRPVSQRIGNRPDLEKLLYLVEKDEYVKRKLIKV